MLAGTLVTIAGFVPVGFAASSAGEYTFTLFAVVAIALLVSWFVAVHLRAAAGRGHSHAAAARRNRVTPAGSFGGTASFLTLAMRAEVGDHCLTLGLFVLSILALPLMPRQFFPSSDRPELLVDLTLPQNASIYASETATRRFDALLKNDPDIERWSGYVGRGAIRFYLPLNVQLPEPLLLAGS